MTAYLMRRVLALVPVALLATAVVFLLTVQLPGDPAQIAAGLEATPDVVERVRREMGFDQPVHIQYFNWLSRIVAGDFGRSARRAHQPVGEVLLERIPVSLELMVLTQTVALLIALPTGIVSAVWRNSFLDVQASFVSFILVAVPNFLMGFLLIYLFALTLGWLPTVGFVPLKDGLARNIVSLILPAATLAAHLAAAEMRLIRAMMLEVLRQDYIRTARAKGLRETVVVGVHALKNALIPFITYLGLQTGVLFGGSVIVETVFSVPGMGKLIVDSIFARDFPVIQLVVLVMVFAFLVVNLVVDIIYGMVDPRIRYA